MKKFLVLLAAMTLSSAYAASDVNTITCMIKEDFEGKVLDVKVEFLVKNLGSKKAELLQHPKADEDMGAILVTPNEYTNMTHLNGQGGDLRVSEERIRLFGDGDGYTFVDLVLYKDSGYQKGYVRVSGSGDQMYQNITCSVK